MSRENPVNIAASVKQKILNRARNEKRPFPELVQYYSMERFLYRLSVSEHSEKFILKGALLLRAWGLDEYRPTMDIDVGFGDSVFPTPKKYSLPGILDFPIAKLTCYKPETTIAEKFEAMVKLGEVNSRIKDFYDIMLLAKSTDFDKNKLAESIKKTFQKRGTHIPEKFMDFSEEFISTRQIAWRSFIRKNGIGNAPENFDEVIDLLKSFLDPILILRKNS